MEKKDLKTGMLVQVRKGLIGLIVNDTILYSTGVYDCLINYNNNLTVDNRGKSDIIKVTKVLDGSQIRLGNWTEEMVNANLLWQRKEPLTGFEILEKYLTKDEQIEFYKEFLKSGCKVFKGLDFKYKENYHVIRRAFDWFDSEKGGDYWDNISKRIRDNKRA